MRDDYDSVAFAKIAAPIIETIIYFEGEKIMQNVSWKEILEAATEQLKEKFIESDGRLSSKDKRRVLRLGRVCHDIVIIANRYDDFESNKNAFLEV